MLEHAIQENTAAIKELIAALKAGIPTTAAQVAAVAQEAAEQAIASPAPTATAGADKATVSARENGASSTPESPPAEAAAQENPAPENVVASDMGAVTTTPAAESVTYKQTADAVLALVKAKGTEAAKKVLTKHGISKLPEAKATAWPAILADCQAAMGD